MRVKSSPIQIACLGILLEEPLPVFVNRACIDLIAFRQSNCQASMFVISNFHENFIPMSRIIGFQVMPCPDMELKSLRSMQEGEKAFLRNFEVWKAYYANNPPVAPPLARNFYKCRVLLNEPSTIRLSQGNPNYPVVEKVERIVPPGNSPNINKIPPRHTMNNWITNPIGF